jgi:helicase SWR1
LEKAIEEGTVFDEETQQRVTKLHTVLRPYLLRRLKRDVEKELPSKYEHIVRCRLSKRQRFLYDEFMSRAQTREDLSSGIYQRIANILMQLRKVCNHPDLFEVRPINTSFALDRSVIADFEIKELLIRRQLFGDEDERNHVNLDVLGLRMDRRCDVSLISALETRRLEQSITPFLIAEQPGPPPPPDTRTVAGFKRHLTYQRKAELHSRWSQMSYLNRMRCSQMPIYNRELISRVKQLYTPLVPFKGMSREWDDSKQILAPLLKSYVDRATDLHNIIEKYAFATPAVVARDLPDIVMRSVPDDILTYCRDHGVDEVLHQAAVKLQIAFPDKSLLQYDSGKLQELARLLRERKSGGHRVLIFTQMTRILDILEIFLNYHGYLYLRLDGATKIEDRQYITERFNADERIFAFIASSRSGGVGIKYVAPLLSTKSST